MSVQDVITRKLAAAFRPESLQVDDESHLHEGHAGHRPGGETHFRVYIVSAAFEGKSRIERHRMINAALAGELAGPVLGFRSPAPAVSASRGTGVMRSAVMRLRSRRSTRKRKPWKVKPWPRS